MSMMRKQRRGRMRRSLRSGVGILAAGALMMGGMNHAMALPQGGQVAVNLKMQTSVHGLFAAGDMRQDAPKQVVCAAGDGAVAALSAIAYLQGHDK